MKIEINLDLDVLVNDEHPPGIDGMVMLSIPIDKLRG